MRRLDVVIDRMIEHIPDEELTLLHQLESVKSSYQFASPESKNIWWREGQEVLKERFGEYPPEEEWETRIADIWMDKA